jgi:hypothetical protein
MRDKTFEASNETRKLVLYCLGAECGDITRPSTTDHLRTMKSRPQLAGAGCDVKDHNMEPMAQGTILLLRLFSLRVIDSTFRVTTIPVSVDGAGYKCLYSEGVDIMTQNGHTKQHIQYWRTFMLGDEQLAV